MNNQHSTHQPPQFYNQQQKPAISTELLIVIFFLLALGLVWGRRISAGWTTTDLTRRPPRLTRASRAWRGDGTPGGGDSSPVSRLSV